MNNYGVLTQAKVESEIMRISDSMQPAVEDLAKYAEEAANADVDYRVAYARRILEVSDMPGSGRGGKMTEGDKDAMATKDTELLLRTRVVTQAHHEVAQERLRMMRAQLDSLRTISANIRSQT